MTARRTPPERAVLDLAPEEELVALAVGAGALVVAS
jgi:hypothetical protein